MTETCVNHPGGSVHFLTAQWIYNTFTTDACWSIYNTSFILQSDFSSTLLILQGLRHAQSYPRSKLSKPRKQSERGVSCTVKDIADKKTKRNGGMEVSRGGDGRGASLWGVTIVWTNSKIVRNCFLQVTVPSPNPGQVPYLNTSTRIRGRGVSP